MQATQIGRLLRSLAPTNEEDLSLLQKLVVCARLMQQRGHSDLQLGPRLVQAGIQDSQPGAVGFDLPAFLRSIPEDARRYLHGLVEAMDIYQSIYGRPLSTTLSDQCVRELKQIRDMCLEEGLRSIY